MVDRFRDPGLFDLEEGGEHFAGFAFDDVGEGVGVERRLGANIDGAGTGLARPVDEVGGRVDGAGGADNEHEGGFVELLLDAIHFEGDFAEEDDVRAEAATTGAMADFCEALVDGVVFDGWAAAVEFAVSLVEFAVHVEEADGAGAFVKVVDVLGAEEEAVAEAGFELGKSDVRGIRLRGLGRGAARGVELPDERWVAGESFGRADVLNAMARPKAVGGAKGRQAAFSADASAGKDEDAIGGSDGDDHGSGAGGFEAVAEELDGTERT